MIVTTWNNGSFKLTGAGYGIRIPKEYRDSYFRKSWDSVIIRIEEAIVEIKLRDTFWGTCGELRSKEIGLFLINNGLGEWHKGQPHEVNLTALQTNEFRLSL